LVSKETKFIVVAHRLSTVRRAELILYIDEGQVIAKGTFEALLREVPQFAINANLMGIN
jgi:ABC-type multidrug transport system fused ATPase/permease subunit